MISLSGYRPRFKFTFLLLIISLVIVGFSSLWMLEAYQNSLIRQTERMLAIQGIQLASTYRHIFLSEFSEARNNYGIELPGDMPEEFEKSSTRWQLPVRAIFINIRSNVIHEPLSTPTIRRQPDEIGAFIGKQMSPMLVDANTTTSTEIDLTDFEGTIISSTKHEIGFSVSDRPEFQHARKGTHHTLLRKTPGDENPPIFDLNIFSDPPRIHSVVPIRMDGYLIGTVLLSKDPPPVFDTQGQRKRAHKAVKYGIAIVILLMLYSLVTSWFVTKPISRLVQQIARARQAKVPVERLNFPVTKEIDELSEAVSSMSEQLVKRANYIEADARFLAHELESEIGSIRYRLSLLRDNLPELSSSQNNQIAEILADADRLIAAGNTLLVIAKAEVLEVGANDTAIMSKVLADIRSRYQDPSPSIQIDCDQSTKVSIDEQRLNSIVVNLVDNAYTHGGHSVRVRASTDNRKGVCIIDVENEGTTISGNNASRIFDLFFTTRSDEGNNGLGLNLVKTLLQAHKGDIALLPDTGNVTFRITLPLKE